MFEDVKFGMKQKRQAEHPGGTLVPGTQGRGYSHT